MYLFNTITANIIVVFNVFVGFSSDVQSLRQTSNNALNTERRQMCQVHRNIENCIDSEE